MDSMTIPLNAPSVQDPMEKTALELLKLIQQYVESWRFTPTGLARGLGRRDIDAVESALAWLAANDYIRCIGSAMYRLTTKGWAHEGAALEHSDNSDDEDS